MNEAKPETELVEVFRTLDLGDADLRKEVLEAAGIDVMIKDDMAAQNLGELVGGVKLLVRAEDEVFAREILALRPGQPEA